MSENQKKYKNFLFDCDGVILDSNQIKSEGFRIALSNEDTKLVDQFLDYHKDNQGIDRYNKIKFFLSEIKKVEYCDKDFNFIIKKYSNYCLKELQKKGLIKIENFKKNPNKLNYLYLLTPKGISEKSEMTLNFMTQ